MNLYLTSIYFTVTTITTVGYGDISGTNKTERIFCIFIMVAGVIAFSFASGSLASIIQNYDNQNAKVTEKMSTLKKISENYFLPKDLQVRLKKAINSNLGHDFEELNDFCDELPHNLRIEVSLYIHEETYKNIFFLKGKSTSFIAWVCPLLKTYMIT